MRTQAAGSTDPNGVNALIQLQLLKELRRMNRKKADSDDSSDNDILNGNARSKFNGIMKMRRRLEKNPRSITRKYESKVKQRLQVTSPQQVWSYTGYSQKLLPKLGKMKGLWRCHYLMSCLLEKSATEDLVHLQAAIVQSLKAIHQVCLDGGSWAHGAHLMPVLDPLLPEEFGGEMAELKAVSEFTSAVSELRRNRNLKGQTEEAAE